MAKSVTAPVQKGSPRSAGKPASPGLWRTMMMAVILLLVLILSPGTMLILGVGMLPTVVAFIIDRTSGKSAAATVGGINFIGVFPFLFQLWVGGDGLPRAATALADPVSLVAMYAAAAVGWGIYASIPPAISTLRRVSAMKTVRKLRARQKEMTEEWGEGISRTA